MVVCIGVAGHDVIAASRDTVTPDGRIIADEIIEAGGGNAATASVTLVRLGVPTCLIARVGEDATGAKISAGLERQGVDVRGLRGMAGVRSPTSVIVVNSTTAERSIVTYPGASRTIVLNDEELAQCAQAEWIHVDQQGFQTVTQIRRAGIGTPVSLDAGNPIEGLSLAQIDLFAPTESALLRLMEIAELEAALRAALKGGPRIVAVTRGAAGSVALTREALEPVYVAPFTIPGIVSTLGAGDVFHGALVAGLVHGLDVGGALRYANAAAALSCRGLGAQSEAIPTREELDAFLSDF